MIQKLFWVLYNLRPSKVKRLFQHIHKFAPYDKELVGFKYAIHYGRLYFVKSEYDNGILDKKKRAEQVDSIIKEYTNPTSRTDYIKLLKELQQGLIKCNNMGFISCGKDKEATKQEAIHYQKATDSLRVLIPAVRLYPILWRTVFLPS